MSLNPNRINWPKSGYDGAGRGDIWEPLLVVTTQTQLWVAPERKKRWCVVGGGNTVNGLNLPGGSLYGFGRLHIPLDDV